MQNIDFYNYRTNNMLPNIADFHTKSGVNAERIVRRIVSYIPTDILEGLNAIILLDTHHSHAGFSRYIKDKAEIELYIHDIIYWQPWLLKHSFIFPYLTIGLALGHEIDHHVNRNNHLIDIEHSAETNALKYIYPSMGLFKPIINLILFLTRKRRASTK